MSKTEKPDTTAKTCSSCGHTLEEDWIVCPWCAKMINKAKKQTKKTTSKVRGNGTGTAYKRGKTWTAKVVMAYTVADDNTDKKDDAIPENTPTKPIIRTKGGFRTKTEALAYCSQLRSNPDKPKSTETFYQIYQRWKTIYEKRVAKVTMATYTAAFTYFKPLYYIKIVDIVYDQLQKCINDCPKKRSTKNNMRTVASLVFKYAIQNNILTHNPAETLDCGREKKGTHLPFTKAELALIKANIGKLDYADYVYFLCFTGFRPGEMLALKKDAYDEEHQCLIGGSKTKAGINRVITISPKVLPIL